MDVFITATTVDCGDGYAYAAATVTGDATPPFTYLWSNGLTTQNVVLFPGMHSVTVTDAIGQMASDTVTISAPPTVGVEIVTENQICGIAPDGTATAIPFGGTPPYSYEWNTGDMTAQITGLTAGVYTVTVTDAAGCTAVGMDSVLFWDEGLWLMIMPTDIDCYGNENGMLEVGPMSGTPPYMYIWSTGDTTKKINDLGPGTYTVTVTDANGCSAEISGEVQEPPAINLSIMVSPAACDSATSCATVEATGGTPPFTYMWNTGDTTETICGLSPDIYYYVTVNDANGCPAVDSAMTTIQPLEIDIELLSCAGCVPSGSATVTVVNGSGDYTINWSNGEMGDTATMLPVGFVSVFVMDNVSGCMGEDSILVPECPELEVEIEILNCSGCVPSGSAQGIVNQDDSNIVYEWFPSGEIGPIATMLPAGPITLIVKDSITGCKDTAMVDMPMCDTLDVSVEVTAQATCMSGGEASVIVSGGTPPYTYEWSVPQMPSDSTATNLPAGTHTVTVTDATGCTAAASFEVEQIAGPDASITVDQEADCPNDFLGQLTAVATGGVAPYVYFWDTGDTTATIDSLPPGIYCVTITDANGCAASACDTLELVPLPDPIINVVALATCLEGATVTVSVSGGTPPFTYEWTGGLDPSGTVTDVAPGTYTVTVTDAGMCTASAEVTVEEPLMPDVTIIASGNATCTDFGFATAEATGGTPGYTYEWSNGETGPTADMLEEGTYTVTVTDAGGCKDSTTVTIGFVDNGVKIGDYVWYDDDQDGFQDPTDTDGVVNVTVMLMQAGPDGIFGTNDDVTVQTTTTDADGMYMFGCVTPGDYVLMFSGIPAGYQWTGQDQVNNDCLDSDVNSNGKTDVFTITQGQADDFCFDAGIHTVCIPLQSPGSICCDQTICEGDMPDPLVEAVPPSGGVGNLEYLWMTLVQIGQAPPQWVGIPGATSPNYQPGPLFQTSFFMRCVRREGCEAFLETNVITITVLPADDPDCVNFSNSFNVVAISNNSVKVDWSTYPEAVQYMYTVEHSMDGIIWNELTSMLGHFDQANMNTYDFLHQTPLMGRNHYRIKRTNPGGTEAFTEERYVDLNMGAADAVLIYPNPVNDMFYVQNMMEYENDVKIDLVAANGQQLHTLTIPANSLQKMEVSVNSLPAGMYFLHIQFGNGDRRVVKVAKF